MIYLNNAASSYPKPDSVRSAVSGHFTEPPSNPYRENVSEKSILDCCRENLCALFHFDRPERMILCSGATEAANMAIFGLISRKCHVITTQMEHNAVLRPLYFLRDKGLLTLDILAYHPHKGIDFSELQEKIRDDTVLVAINHASNVTGRVQEFDEIHSLCRDLGLALLLDAAQSAGCVDIDLSGMDHSIVVFTGHKALLGPPGTGGMAVGTGLNLAPWKFGGTGMKSDLESMPGEWPSKFEPGTPNYPGIAGFSAGIGNVLEKGIATQGERRKRLVKKLDSVLGSQGYTCYSEEWQENPCGIVSFCLDGWSCEDIGYILGQSYQIRVRAGLHCAPLIHKALGTYPGGTVRVSFSGSNTEEEVNILAEALETIRRGS